MLRTLFWLCWLVILLIRYIPYNLKARRLGRQGKTAEQRQYVNNKIQHWARLLLKHLKTNLVVSGTENLPAPGQAVVFVSNHQSYMDIPAIIAALDYPRPFVAKESLGKVPLLGSWMRLWGCLLLDREDLRSAGNLARQVEARLAQGESIFICPEGTRSKSDAIGEFKSGAVHMAAKARVPILPVVIDGTYKVLEGNHYRVQPADVNLRFLPAISVESMSRSQLKALPKLLEDTIRSAKDSLQKEKTEQNK